MRKIAAILSSVLMWMVLLTAAAMAGEVTILAAVSLQEVINELAENFSRQNPDIRILKNYGASGALAKQIWSGARADIFISANLEWTNYLQSNKLTSEACLTILAYDTLVVIGTTDKRISSMRDLGKLEKIAIGNPKSVPAGEYAVEALKKAGVEEHLKKKLVMARDVRECLVFAERGEVDAAFVYKSDALQVKQARVLFAVPEDLYPRVTYSMRLTPRGAKHKDAEAFYRFLQGQYAKAVLGKYGFTAK